MRLKDKVAVITGATGFIGRATAKLYIEEGASVMLVARGGDKLDELAKSLGSDRVATCAADVSSAADSERYIKETVTRFGPIDILFANAGIEGPSAPIHEFPEDGWDHVMDINVKGVFFSVKYGLPHMRDGGSIIITSSVAGLTGSPGLIAYSASKHAVIGIMRSAAMDAAKRKIRVNTLHPAMVESDMIKRIESAIDTAAGQEVAHKAFLSKVPLGRYIEPEEVAQSALFLGSDESRMVTGTTMVIDGGFRV